MLFVLKLQDVSVKHTFMEYIKKIGQGMLTLSLLPLIILKVYSYF